MLAGEFSSRWIWYKIPYMCIIARASTNRMILFAFRFDCSRRLRYDIDDMNEIRAISFDGYTVFVSKSDGTLMC
jgi:hypothetical protein